MKIYSVILAGGGGTRFWPLSRQNTPKQILNISGNDIMINETINRCSSLIGYEDTFIVTGKSQVELLKKVLIPSVPANNILGEPVGKNTAACIVYAALYLKKKFNDGIMVVLPSDHFISDERSFAETLSNACSIADESGKLVTIGIKPTFPSTGYGYIRYDPKAAGRMNGAYEVSEFVEKPDFQRAKTYLESRNYLWNSGMFIWKISVILENFKRYLPRLYNSVLKLYEYMDTGRFAEVLDEVYPGLQSISIDYGILERSDEVLVVPGDFGWNDVGSWDALGSIFPVDNNGNIVKAKHVGIHTRNSIIYSTERLVATIGVDNLIIADTGDALLICPKENAQEVKDLVEMLRKNEMKEYL